MKQEYKNKRDFYKAEAQRERERAYELERELKKLQDEKRRAEEQKKKDNDRNTWYDVVTYCSNCQMVSSYRVRKGLTINEAGCLVCNSKNTLFPVKKYPGMFSI